MTETTGEKFKSIRRHTFPSLRKKNQQKTRDTDKTLKISSVPQQESIILKKYFRLVVYLITSYYNETGNRLSAIPKSRKRFSFAHAHWSIVMIAIKLIHQFYCGCLKYPPSFLVAVLMQMSVRYSQISIHSGPWKVRDFTKTTIIRIPSIQ